MDSRLEALLKGIGAEIPIVRGYIEALDSKRQSDLTEQLETKKIDTLAALVREIHLLNPNLGRGLDIREGWIVRRAYHTETRSNRGFDSYSEHFDKEAWGIETVVKDSMELFDAVVLFLVFHNDDRDTTITDVNLIVSDGEREIDAILDRVKKGSNDWETVDRMDYTAHIPANASIKLFLRFVSPSLIGHDETPAILKIQHTSDSPEKMLSVTQLNPVPKLHWCIKSDGGKSFGFAAFPSRRRSWG